MPISAALGQLAKALREAYVYDGQFSEFRQRRQGRPAATCQRVGFVCCLQNHDQVGNRALGRAHLGSRRARTC